MKKLVEKTRPWCRVCGGWFGSHYAPLHELEESLQRIIWDAQANEAIDVANSAREEETWAS